jgi:peptidoglycan hydrolase-like protein with peptidoglycan-binding domain
MTLKSAIVFFGRPAFAGAMLLAATAVDASAQSVPPPGFDGTNTTYQILRGSNLRRGDRLSDSIVATLWGGGDVKGSGRCTEQSCPVIYNGENLYARRSRVRVLGIIPPGQPGQGGGYTGPSINRTLRRGDSGEEVRILQEALNRAGARIEVDGNYGRGTVAAVEDFQRRRGLTADGSAGPRTLAALGLSGGSGSSGSAPPPSGGSGYQINQTLRRGDRGEDVRALQEALNRNGARLQIDSNYGSGTVAAVEDFQRRRGLNVDGSAGPITLRALGL